jgi:hypothetical protein
MKKYLLKINLNVFVRTSRVFFAIGLVCWLFGFSEGRASEPVKVSLADNGSALHSVVVASGASQLTRDAAKDLADYLGRISGGDFKIIEGDGTEGIAVGTYKDFPNLGFESLFNIEDPTRWDEYLLRTHDKGAYLVGATEIASQHAVWGFLDQIGYRQFFPTDTWEFVPENPDLSVEMDVFERPDFYSRNGPRKSSYSLVSETAPWDRWHDRNRMTSSFSLNTAHIYDEIIRVNKAEFDAHPEYRGLVDGVRSWNKFCISNEGLRNLVVKDAERRIRENPEAVSISMEPSDGGHWCECEACAAMGSVTDRVVLLSNEVATAINNMGYGDKYVGILSYNEHSPAPNVDAHPKVIVSVATKFIKGGYTVEGLIEGWSRHTEMIGIREYYDVFVWDYSMPRKAPGGNINYLAEKIPYYYEKGIRFMNAESGAIIPSRSRFR